MGSLTTFYGLYLPVSGDGAANGQVWGGKVNNNFTVIDATMNSLVTKVNPRTTGTYQHGTVPHYFEVESDGTPVMHGNATAWEDVNISLIPPQGGAALPSVIPFNGDARLDCYAFSGTNPTPDELHSSLEVPHSYLEGSDIHLHIHWHPTTSNVGDVKWQVRYSWFNQGEVPPAATAASSVHTTPGVAWKSQFTDFVLSGAGKTFGSRLMFVVFRDAVDPQDTYSFDAAVTDIGVHFESDTLGSRQINTK